MEEQQNNINLKEFEQILLSYTQRFQDSKILNYYIPDKFEEKQNVQLLIKPINNQEEISYDYDALTKALSTPILDLLNRGGKRMRPILCMLIAECFGKQWDFVLEIAGCCECIHNASLIVDDIEDSRLLSKTLLFIFSSELRRGEPCIHLKFGIDIALNAGNFLYYAPIMKLLNCQKYKESDKALAITEIYLEEMVNIHLGQGWDIAWHNQLFSDNKVPTEKQYFQMCSNKTGVLLRMNAKMCAAALGLDKIITEQIVQFVEAIGIAFQIQDDILNLVGMEYQKGKGYNGEDITEGKITIMVIHSIAQGNQQDKEDLLKILKKHTRDISEINQAIEIIKKTNSIEYAKGKAKLLVDSAWENVNPHLPENKFKEILRFFSIYCIERNK